jgi:hypothetical protein
VGELADAVADSIAALDLAARDRGAAALCHALALEIDRAGAAERVADRALRLAENDDRDPELQELIRALKAKVSHRDAIVRCGQRLEAMLAQLGATPSSRGKTGTTTTPSFGGPLAVLRGGAAGVTG